MSIVRFITAEGRVRMEVAGDVQAPLEVPDDVAELAIADCLMIPSRLPDGLRRLEVSFTRDEVELDARDLPRGLKRVVLLGATITNRDLLPDGVRVTEGRMTLSNQAIDGMMQVPGSVRELILRDCVLDKVTLADFVRRLPRRLRRLEILNVSAQCCLMHVSDLPRGLEHLTVRGCGSDLSLFGREGLPPGLAALSLDQDVHRVAMPAGLRILVLEGGRMPDVSACLLDLALLTRVSVREGQPIAAVTLEMSGCAGTPRVLPPCMILVIRDHDCAHDVALCGLPDSLEALELVGCPRIRRVQASPALELIITTGARKDADVAGVKGGAVWVRDEVAFVAKGGAWVEFDV